MTKERAWSYVTMLDRVIDCAIAYFPKEAKKDIEELQQLRSDFLNERESYRFYLEHIADMIAPMLSDYDIRVQDYRED